jgi:hypothetical protein
MLQARALLLVGLVGGLCACGSSGGSPDSGSPVDATEAEPQDGDEDDRDPQDPPDQASTETEAGAEAPDLPFLDVHEADDGSPADVPLEDLPPDVEIPLSVEVYVDSTGCDSSTPGVGLYRVGLRWTTSIAATSEIELALNDFEGASTVPLDEAPGTEHAFNLAFTAFHFAQVPRVGDLILIRVRARAPAGQVGVSEPISVAVSVPVRACLYPYDPECSDSAPVLCRLQPPSCASPLVLAAFEGCYHCVYSATCTCDDGSEATCDTPAPTCAEGQVLAVQEGCFACVFPSTCLPAE